VVTPFVTRAIDFLFDVLRAPVLGVKTLFEVEQTRLYVTERFPFDMDLEQEGELIATGFVGQEDKTTLRFYSVKKMDEAAQEIEASGDDPVENALDDRLAKRSPPEVLSQDVRLENLFAPRAVAFAPQIAVLVPRAGDLLRGAVAVNVTIRDPEVERISCKVFERKTGVAQTLRISSAALSKYHQKTGLTWNDTPGASKPEFRQQPTCLFGGIPTGEYLLEVEASKGSVRFSKRVPFSYEK
jgi:hypothetical protein